MFIIRKSAGKPFQPTLMFAGKVGAYLSEVHPIQGRLTALFTNSFCIQKLLYDNKVVQLTHKSEHIYSKLFLKLSPGVQYYTTFYSHNCCRSIISQSVCHYHPLPPQSNICRQGEEPTFRVESCWGSTLVTSQGNLKQ